MDTYDTTTRNWVVFIIIATFIYGAQMFFVPILGVTAGGILPLSPDLDLTTFSSTLTVMAPWLFAWGLMGIYTLTHKNKILLIAFLQFGFYFSFFAILNIAYQSMTTVGVFTPITAPSVLYILSVHGFFALLLLYLLIRNK